MTPRATRLSSELSADLLAEQHAPTPAVGARSAVPSATVSGTPSGPFVETTWLLSPRAWRRPRMHRADSALVIGLGPLQIRGGRR